MANNNSTSKLLQLPLPIDGETIQIPLTRGNTAIVDAIDADLIQVKWYSLGKPGYEYASRCVITNKVEKRIMMHRVILERISGQELPPERYVDHINRNRLDNRRANLRLATLAQNRFNAGVPTNLSGYRGVTYDSNKWRATIHVNRKKIALGYYDTPEEAYLVYCKAAVQYFGEFAPDYVAEATAVLAGDEGGA